MKKAKGFLTIIFFGIIFFSGVGFVFSQSQQRTLTISMSRNQLANEFSEGFFLIVIKTSERKDAGDWLSEDINRFVYGLGAPYKIFESGFGHIDDIGVETQEIKKGTSSIEGLLYSAESNFNDPWTPERYNGTYNIILIRASQEYLYFSVSRAVKIFTTNTRFSITQFESLMTVPLK
jgi:hypothetical protein